jgi:hypothetical protein
MPDLAVMVGAQCLLPSDNHSLSAATAAFAMMAAVAMAVIHVMTRLFTGTP